MPNWVITELKLDPEIITQYLADLEDGEGKYLDMSKLIPEPENIEKGGCTGQHEEGVICWYSWRVDNWGTKWPPRDLRVEATEGDLALVRFETAWSHPLPIITALSLKHPAEKIQVRWSDEDFGYNVGEYSIQGTKTEGPGDLSNTPEGNEIAADLWYGTSYEEAKKQWEEYS